MASPSSSESSSSPSMSSTSPLRYYQRSQADNQLLPLDLIIQIFMHLAQEPQDLLNCALTTRNWAAPALQELYRHPWSYLFTYQFETEGRVMDKYGSMLLLRTLFQGCMDPTRTTLPYASFARSINLKWVHDTFDLPEVDIQNLTGFRWTRNEAPKDYLIRHLLANRPYLSDFVHCHAPRLPRCLFAHMTTTVAENNADDAAGGVNGLGATVLPIHETDANGAMVVVEPAETINTAHTASTDSDDWETMMQDATNEDLLPPLDASLLTTPPLLPVQQQQPVATAMPLVHPELVHSSVVESSSNNNNHIVNSDIPQGVQGSFLQILNASSLQSVVSEIPHTLFSPVVLPPLPTPFGSPLMTATIQDMEEGEIETTQTADGIVEAASIEETNGDIVIDSDNQEGVLEVANNSNGSTSEASSSSSMQPVTATGEPQLVYGFQQPFDPSNFTDLHSRSSTSSSSSASSAFKPFLATWPLTLEQTTSLVYLDLRCALVSDSLLLSLATNCHRIESLKVATHWQHFPHSYSVTDHALACLVASQRALKLVHVDNHREISQGHELVKTIDILAKYHGETLESLVLKSHDFQNCRLTALGKACKRLSKFSAPGGMHLIREEVLGLTEACKLTLEHLDFSNSDIETECLMTVMKGLSTPAAAKGVLKALVLLGMEDMLNQDTCTAIGEHGSGLDCFRLDILESEARDVGLMLSRPCALNLRVLTLGCHDVHGELSNNILEQISLNCRNLELLDVNHWQFSASAIEAVMRECGMLRYLNVSYTDISESTAEIICRCLGEVKEVSATVVSAAPANYSADSPLSTPLLVGSLTGSHLQTPAPIQSSSSESTSDPMLPTRDSMDQVLSEIDEVHERTDLEALEEERVELLRKQRGIEARTKDGEFDDDEGGISGGNGGDDYMDANMDHDPQFVTPVYCANGEGGGGTKKQSQLGLVHHHSNAMDLRTIMNLDLDMDLSISMDEMTGMDLDMCLDLERYHRKSLDKVDSLKEGDDEGEMEYVVDEELEGAYMDLDAEGAQVEEAIGVGIGAGGEGEEAVVRVREPKGKDIDRGGEPYGHHHGSLHFVAPGAPSYSTSYESTSSSSSSAPSSSSSSSSSSSFKSDSLQGHDGYISLQAAEARALDAFHCTPLLPALPIPSSIEDDDKEQGPFLISVSAGSSMSLPPGVSNSAIDCPMSKSSDPVVSDGESNSNDASGDAPFAIAAAGLLIVDEDMVPPPPPLPSTEAGAVEIPASHPTTSMDPATATSTSATTNSATVTATAGVIVLDEASLGWTKESRLEQVNVECCSHLSLATMTKIKTLGQDRQADLTRQGRKKSRIWRENEHDMMMTRLAVERGPELPAERLIARVSTITSSSSNTASSTTSSSEVQAVPGAGAEAVPVPQSQEAQSQDQEQGVALEPSELAVADESMGSGSGGVSTTTPLTDESVGTATALEVMA
ncbi:hypothetical protein BGX23_001502 [Mortierella sp. AD031]|nr:hypothetical protein BGX23_001502 [Mortierella sp. AD031]